MFRYCLCVSLFATAVIAQQSLTHPLETVTITGSSLSRAEILNIAGLHIGMPLNKAAIDEACNKLSASGLFQSVNYHYGPAANNGYALTLTLLEDKAMIPAVIDIPGVDENEMWRWLISKYPAFDHKVPRNEAAQERLARQIQEHVGAKLDGQPLVTRTEVDFTNSGASVLVFQPEMLPRVAQMDFTGNHALSSAELAAVMDKINAEQEYSDRRFRRYVELNLRRAYEDHGFYRAQFPSITAKKVDARMVDVTVAIDEGPQYTLGNVEIAGGDLPREAMLKAGNFKVGKTANWTEIQKGIWEAEKPVKRTGYNDAVIDPRRIFDDQQHILNLRLEVRKGPLYHFGTLTINGLPSNIEAKAREMWKKKPGDVYDFEYLREYFRELSRLVDPRLYKYGAEAKNEGGDHTMDVTLTFTPRG